MTGTSSPGPSGASRPPSVTAGPASSAIAAALGASRRERVLAELIALKGEIDNWIDEREDQDLDENNENVGRQRTRLEVLHGVLDAMLDELKERLPSLPTGNAQTARDPAGAGALDHRADELNWGRFYQDCWATDQSVTWVRRLWEFYKGKFDQRGDKRRMALLLAADEVVWSCYERPASDVSARRPAPLCYVEAESVPTALVSSTPVGAVANIEGNVAALESFTKKIPIPLVKLPPWCVNAPWWLVYIGHEIGHHVYSEWAAQTGFQDAIQWAADAVAPDLATRWWNWHEEVFADLYSVLAMGNVAGLALSEFLWASPARMTLTGLFGESRYPPSAVRIELVARFAAEDALKSSGPGVPSSRRWENWKAMVTADPSAGAARVAEIELDLKVVDKIVANAFTPRFQPLAELARRLKPRNPAPGWADVLLGRSVLSPDPQREVARQVASESLTAWMRLNAAGGAALGAESISRLADRTATLIRACAEKGVRAGDPGTEDAFGDPIALGQDQARALRARFGGTDASRSAG